MSDNSNNPPFPGFMRVSAVAKQLGVTDRTIKQWIADGHLPTVKWGGTVYIPQRFFEEAARLAIDAVKEGQAEQ